MEVSLDEQIDAVRRVLDDTGTQPVIRHDALQAVLDTLLTLKHWNTEAEKKKTWDRPMLERFTQEYEKHKADKEATFIFDDEEYLVAYAKYLIEFLDGMLYRPGPRIVPTEESASQPEGG